MVPGHGGGQSRSSQDRVTSSLTDNLPYPHPKGKPLLSLATYWAVWCASPRPHPHQCCRGERILVSITQSCCSVPCHIDGSEADILTLEPGVSPGTVWMRPSSL